MSNRCPVFFLSKKPPKVQIWSAAQCGKVFVDSVVALSGRKAKLPEGSILAWDKDDDEAMRFVAACANIRAMIFGIPMKTAFEIKCRFFFTGIRSVYQCKED